MKVPVPIPQLGRLSQVGSGLIWVIKTAVAPTPTQVETDELADQGRFTLSCACACPADIHGEGLLFCTAANYTDVDLNVAMGPLTATSSSHTVPLPIATQQVHVHCSPELPMLPPINEFRTPLILPECVPIAPI